MEKKIQELWILAGVTAAGKTELSLQWAEKYNAEIISCDSVSFYRGLDIGSAKPNKMEQARVVHHGLDIANVSEVFDVGRFHAYAQKTIEEIVSRGKKVLVVGGSGFFLQGFLRPVVDNIEVSPHVRKYVQTTYEQKGMGGLRSELETYNPEGLGELDLNNPIRVIRALERCMQSGCSLFELRKEFEKLPIPYAQFEKKMIWLNREDVDITNRIEKRAEKMMDMGIIDETQRALQAGIEKHPSLCEAVGYREVIHYLKTGGSKDELVNSLVLSTRKLVSKQRKWFRKHFPAGSSFVENSQKSISVDHIPWVAGT